MYVMRPPCARALGQFVASLEIVADAPAHERERIVATGEVAMIFTFADDGFAFFDPAEQQAAPATLVGPSSSPHVVTTRAQRGMLAVNFRPGGAAVFLRAPLAEAADAFVPLDVHWGPEAARLRDRLLDARGSSERFDLVEESLMASMREPVVEEDIRAAIAALDRGARVAAVVDRFGTTSKPFIRRFTSATGLTPKRYSRVRRVQRVLRSIRSGQATDWASVAVEHGFYDQSHLIHDFTLITGGPPAGHHARSTGEINHIVC